MGLKKNRGVEKDNLLKSPLPQSFQYNNARISDEEHHRVLSSILRVQDEIAHLVELDAAEGASQATYQRRRACEDFIQSHKKLLHWTRRLPPEILACIFTWCSDDNTVIPWNVSQVCRRWRAIALKTPRLWRRIPSVRRCGSRAAEQRLLTFLSDDYLFRSGAESIIFLWFPLFKLANQFYAIFLDHAERWGNAALSISSQDDLLHTRFIGLEGRLPSLYALKLTSCDIRTPADVSLEPFKSAPHLRYLEVIDCHGRFVSSEAQLLHGWPWKQVSHINAIFFSTSSVYDFGSLSGFSHVVYLRMSFWHSNSAAELPATSPPVIFNSCKHLHLRLTGPPPVNFSKLIQLFSG